MSEESLSNRIFSGVLWSMMERFGAQLISLVIQIILARILLPEEYGLIAIALVFITLANTVTVDGLNLALVQKKDANNVDFSTGFYLNIVTSASIYAIIFFAAPYIASFYAMPALCDLLRVLGIMVPVSSLNCIQRAYVSRNMLFKRFFVSTLIGNTISGLLGIVAAYSGLGVWALAIQSISAVVLDTAILWVTVRWRPSLAFSFERLKQLWGFGWKILASNLIYQFCIQLRSLVIGKVYSASDLAYFNRGEQLPSLVALNADAAIQAALFPAMSKVQSDKERMANMLRQAVKTGCYVIFPLMAVLAATAEPLVTLLLTEKWLPAVPFVWVFCATYSLQTLQSVNLLAIRAVGKSGTTLLQDCIKRCFDIGLLLFSIQFGVIGIALSSLASSCVAVIVNTYPCRKMFGYSLLGQLRDVAPCFVVSVLTGAAVFGVGMIPLPVWARLVLQVLVAGILYFGVTGVLKFESFSYLKENVVSRFLKK